MTDIVSRSSVLPHDALFATAEKRQFTRLDTRWTKTSVAIVSAHGDIDVTNACTLTDYSVAHATRCRGLILDLTGLEFFGTEGFLALHRISVCCARAAKGWALVPGAAVSRLLRICDPHDSLPVADTVGGALASLQRSASDAAADTGKGAMAADSTYSFRISAGIETRTGRGETT